MTAIHCTPIRFTAIAALLLWSSLSWATKPEGAAQLSEAEWASVKSQIVAHRYRADGDAAEGYRAHSDSLGLAQRYHPDGRTEVEGQQLGVSLQLEAYGYGDLIRPGTPALRAEADGQGAVVHYQWDKNLREWWHNRPGTLEQWFELQHRPAGADGGPLQVQMALQVPEGTPVHLDAMGRELRIGEGAGALHYSGLKVWDANGTTLLARMHLNESGDLLLSIDDANARYPVTIDPVWTQQVYFKASNAQAQDWFGYSAALFEDTLVVGAPHEDSSAAGVGGNESDNSSANSGAAYVFVRIGSSWQQQAYLKASNPGGVDNFGYSVAVWGDTVVVGAPGERSWATGVNGEQFNNDFIDSGAAYVFFRAGGTFGSWSQQAYLKASNTGVFDEFGYSVAISGDLIVVGAPGESSSATGVNGNQSDNSAEGSGAAYTFGRGSIGTWSPIDYLKASNTGVEDGFGSSVAIDGATLVVGAPGENSNATGINGNQADNSAVDSGAVYVFKRENINFGHWSQQAYLKASNTGERDDFGFSVAISDETLLVGAPGEASSATGVNGNQSSNSALDSGAAYVFVRAGGITGSWSQQAYLKASNSEADYRFGHAVGLSGDLLAVGSIGESSNTQGVDADQLNNGMFDAGAAYAFVRSGNNWTQQSFIKASNTDFGDLFGYSVAVWSDTLVVGARNEGSPGIGVNGIQGPPNGALASGAAFGFQLRQILGGSVSGLAAGESLTLQNNGFDNLVVNANGAFSMGTLEFDNFYNVTVATQPPGKICTVANGRGRALTDITDIQVNCAVGAFTLSGTVSGIDAGQTMALINNNGTSNPEVTMTSNGSFTFSTLYGTGNTYNVVVWELPAVGVTCTVANGSGTVTGNVSNIEVSCSVDTFTIGGTLSGLASGESVTLQNNGGDNLLLDANGSFSFATAIEYGMGYSVSVLSNPTEQICSVTRGSGTATGGVTNVAVTCVTNTYTIGGALSGLASGRSVTLRQGSQNLVLNANGDFAFATGIPFGTGYDVSVLSQPIGQTCTVSNGAGTLSGNVSNIHVSCSVNTYTIGGTLTGLPAGDSLTLHNNGADDLVLGADGAFVFSTRVLHGDTYAVTVSSSPAGRTCLVRNGSGTATSNVSNIQIDCFTGNVATIGGNVSGLDPGLEVTLQNNGGDDLTLSANGAFVFTTPISEGASYLVTVSAQPAQHTCTVSNGTGVATANVTDVTIDCILNSYPISGGLFSLAADRSITLQINGGDDLVLSAGGSFEFSTPLPFGTPYSITVSAQPPRQTCVVFDGEGTAGPFSFITSVICSTDSHLIGGTLSGLAADGSITLQNNGGDDLTLGADGSFVFSVPVSPGAHYVVNVSSQPVGQTCTVSNGSGRAIGINDVTNVSVDCIINTYSIGGTLSGLAANASLTLQNNGADDLELSANGDFEFPTQLPSGTPYSVSVSVQPPGQTCSVASGAGSISDQNVTNIQISCVNIYTVGGNVSGLSGSGLVLQNNGGDDLAIGADGAFTFATALDDLSTYAVTVATQPDAPSQTCVVENGSGIAAADIDNVSVNCTTDEFSIGGIITGLQPGSFIVLQNNAMDTLKLVAGGTFTFPNTLPDLSSYEVTVLAQPFLQNCDVANGVGTLAGADVTDLSIRCERIGIDILPEKLTFGDFDLGDISPDQMAVIENTGDVSFEIMDISLFGTDSREFILSMDTCSDTVLDPDDFCGFEVAFAPSDNGIREAEIIITTDLFVQTFTIRALGTSGVLFFDGFEDL